MSFPDRIERTIELPHRPERVWAALTTADGLSGWFGTVTEIDLRPGAEFDMRFEKEDVTARLRVAVVEPPHRFGYTWAVVNLSADDPRRTFVEFVLEPTAEGTRLTLTESGFAQVPGDPGADAFHGNSKGWAVELDELADYLNAGR